MKGFFPQFLVISGMMYCTPRSWVLFSTIMVRMRPPYRTGAVLYGTRTAPTATSTHWSLAKYGTCNFVCGRIRTPVS